MQAVEFATNRAYEGVHCMNAPKASCRLRPSAQQSLSAPLKSPMSDQHRPASPSMSPEHKTGFQHAPSCTFACHWQAYCPTQ